MTEPRADSTSASGAETCSARNPAAAEVAADSSEDSDFKATGHDMKCTQILVKNVISTDYLWRYVNECWFRKLEVSE